MKCYELIVVVVVTLLHAAGGWNLYQCLLKIIVAKKYASVFHVG